MNNALSLLLAAHVSRRVYQRKYLTLQQLLLCTAMSSTEFLEKAKFGWFNRIFQDIETLWCYFVPWCSFWI